MISPSAPIMPSLSSSAILMKALVSLSVRTRAPGQNLWRKNLVGTSKDKYNFLYVEVLLNDKWIQGSNSKRYKHAINIVVQSVLMQDYCWMFIQDCWCKVCENVAFLKASIDLWNWLQLLVLDSAKCLAPELQAGYSASTKSIFIIYLC